MFADAVGSGPVVPGQSNVSGPGRVGSGSVSLQLLDVRRRNDAERYLVTVAVTNYRDDWARSLVGSQQ
jgi:hypothetical protein